MATSLWLFNASLLNSKLFIFRFPTEGTQKHQNNRGNRKEWQMTQKCICSAKSQHWLNRPSSIRLKPKPIMKIKISLIHLFKKKKSIVWSFEAIGRYKKTLCSEMFVLVKNAGIKCYWWTFKFLVSTQKIHIFHLLTINSKLTHSLTHSLDFLIDCILKLDAGCPLLDSKQVTQSFTF